MSEWMQMPTDVIIRHLDSPIFEMATRKPVLRPEPIIRPSKPSYPKPSSPRVGKGPGRPGTRGR